MDINIQPILENENIILYPINEEDFENLYQAAADPKIWEQHPNKNRWKKEIFRTYFDGAIKSKGAFKIIDKTNQKIIGSTRFYDYDEQENAILIGYTFYTTEYWGKGINHSVKKLMLDYIFQFVSTVYFHIGASNVRSQIAIGRLGTTKVAEQDITYFGEDSKLNYIYRLTKQEWILNKN